MVRCSLTAPKHGNKREWGADDIAALLMRENKIKALPSLSGYGTVMITGTLNITPRKVSVFLSKRRMERLIRKGMKGEPLGDEYLRVAVRAVKPFYRTAHIFNPDRQAGILS
ncbi:MAG: hypothetical protein MZV63_14080 [Marinilabiliales bacterium]|nr:hypothetical protein [Marinilabiliales bacterium]